MNDLVFNEVQWLVVKTHQVVWASLPDYGRLEWQHILNSFEFF